MRWRVAFVVAAGAAACTSLNGLSGRSDPDAGTPDSGGESDTGVRDAFVQPDAGADACEPSVACGECGRRCVLGAACQAGGVCDPVVLVDSINQPQQVAVSAKNYYIATSTQVEWCARANCAFPRKGYGPIPSARYSPAAIAVQNGFVVWVGQTGPGPQGTEGWSMLECPADLSACEADATVDLVDHVGPAAFAAADGSVWFGQNSAFPLGTPTRLRECATTSCDGSIVYTGPLPGGAATAIAVGATELYYAHDNAIRVVTRGKDSNPSSTFASLATLALAYDEGFVYWVEPSGSLKRCSTASVPCVGASELARDLGAVRWMVVDGDYVFVATVVTEASDGGADALPSQDGRVYRVRKGGGTPVLFARGLSSPKHLLVLPEGLLVVDEGTGTNDGRILEVAR